MFNYHCKKTWFKYKRHKNYMESLKVGKLFPARRPFVESQPLRRTLWHLFLGFVSIFATPPRLSSSSLIFIPPAHLDSRRVRWSPSTHLKVGKLFPARRPFVESQPLRRTLWYLFLGSVSIFCYPTSTIVEFVEILQLMPLIDLCQFDQKVAIKSLQPRVLLMIIYSKWANCHIKPKIW